MVRHYRRKSGKGSFTQEQMEMALTLKKQGMTGRQAAKEAGLNYKTVQRYIKKYAEVENLSKVSLVTKFNHRQVFSDEMEAELSGYIVERSHLGYGLTIKQVQELAYELATANNITYPSSWDNTKLAGDDWYNSFMSRRRELSARKPEQCSIARAAAFNKPVITSYFKKLEDVLQRNPRFADGTRTFNADETATSTVGAVKNKIVSPKGVKQVHQVKGQERGVTVTTCFFISAQGSFLPPVMIFPRKNTNVRMLKEAYPGTLGLATKSGWMTKEMFFCAMQHFITHSNSSKENPSLLIFDNVESHLSVETIRLCKDNGVTLFTVPPHTTHKTQPLDVGVYGPFQNAYDKAVHLWTLNNPGEPATIYEVAGFVKAAACEAMKPGNILSAFKKTGIIPFNPQIFPDSDFIKASVTFQPEEVIDNGINNVIVEPPSDINPEPGTSTLSLDVDDSSQSHDPGNSQPKHVSPKDIWALPKQKLKETKRKPRRKGKSAVLTDTPEKTEIERRDAEKKAKEEKQNQRKKEREAKSLKKLVDQAVKNKEKENEPPPKKPKKSTAAKCLNFSTSESDSESVDYQDSSDNWGEEEEEDENHDEPGQFRPLKKEPEEGEYVLVEFKDKNKFYYIAKVLKAEDQDGDLEVSYLRRSLKVKDKFCLPNVPDLKSVAKSDIKMLLPKPLVSGTKRQQNMLSFDVDFSFLNVK